MTTLYEITYRKGSDYAKAQTVATVRAVAEGATGFLCPETRELVKPDDRAVVSVLPHYLRPAFKRSGGWWFPANPGAAPEDQPTLAHRPLYGARGKPLGTLYARIYVYPAKKES
jgi:hypothetical protein